MTSNDRDQQYWHKNLRLTAVLMVVWFVVTLVPIYFARDLNFDFFGWPFSFFMAAQGSLLIYLAIIWFYARSMNRLDHAHDVDEANDGDDR